MTEGKSCQFKSKLDLDYKCKEFSLKGSKFCIFHKPNKTNEEAELFKENIKKKLEKKDCDFKGFSFPPTVDFKDDFGISSFEKEVNFSEAQFENVYFLGVKFKEEVEFRGTQFQEEADFLGAQFEKGVNFWGAQFKNVYFLGVKFKEEVEFSGVKFKEIAGFNKAQFKEEVGFRGAQFKKVDFWGAQFEKVANILPDFIQGEISFQDAIIENISMNPLNLQENALIDFGNARLRNTYIEREDVEGHIKQEQVNDFEEAKKVYLRLKNNFDSLGRYNDESWAFQKEKEMERKSYFNKKQYLKWIWSKFLSLLYGYGERLERPLLLAVTTIFVWAFFYMNVGILDASQQSIVKNFWDSLYFSMVTFTTLGYGDFRPLTRIGRIIAGCEAILGVILIALFIFTFARRTGGR